MKRIRHSPEQISRKLREADADLPDGGSLANTFGSSENGCTRHRAERPNHV